ncbi:MAG: rod shape-determining protein RodA [Actinomycetota bacterium]|nr:rod shape-determining protein RodA [Actinomycetota bacterium]PLS75707.1 MAG: rod shape-determining protein RodA [Actinomycetota bacterium]
MSAETTTALPPRRTALSQRNASAPWRHVDIALMVSVLAIAGLGVLMVYSATQRRIDGDPAFFLRRQAVFALLGVGVMVLFASVDYRVFRDFAPQMYVGIVLLLLLVLSPLGSNRRGAQAWFQIGGFQFQPSELAKVALIVCIAAYAAAHRGDLGARRMLTVLALAAVPMVLINAQPDLGTVLVFLAILLGTLLVGGARPRHMAALGLVGVVAVAGVFQLGLLKDYQRDRLGAFLEPSDKTLQSTYNLNQSKIAIANGGLTGKGLFEGTQTKLAYVPEQHTDFIFTVVGEELGLVGAGLLMAAFAVLVWRMWRAAALAKDLCGTIICVGVLAMFVFQIFENVGMTMGIMPITGIPLPFMSYGGSATIACFAAVGLVLNVHMRRFS